MKNAATWADLVPQLTLTGMAQQLASHCILSSINNSGIRLTLPKEHKHLLLQIVAEKLHKALEAHYKRTLRLMIDVH